MGIISTIKGWFMKDIVCKEDISNQFVYFYPLTSLIKINRIIEVPNGFEAIFVAKDSICDVLRSGRHRITNASLPLVFNKLKLNRTNKKGKYPTKFKCDIYFVNMSDISTNFFGDSPFLIKSNTFGKVKGFAEGMVDFRVLDSQTLIEFLLMDSAYIKNGKAIEKLSVLVGDEVNDVLEKSNVGFKDLITHTEAVHKYLEQEMIDKLSYMGVRILDAEITALSLNKKIQEKVNKYIKNQAEFNEQFENLNIGKVTVNANEPMQNELVESETFIDNGAKVQELDQRIVQELKTATPKDKAKEILFNRSNPNILFNNKNNIQIDAKIDSNFNNAPNLKQCKYCNATIDSSCAFCPKCGFKQDF